MELCIQTLLTQSAGISCLQICIFIEKNFNNRIAQILKVQFVNLKHFPNAVIITKLSKIP